MSRRRKNYRLDRDAAGAPILPADAQAPPDVIEFARGMRRTVDFRPWLGKGLDPIVRACQRALWRKKQSGTREDISLCTYFSSGLSYWFGYLAERSRALGRSLGLKDIMGETVQGYIDYLAHRPARTDSGVASYASQRGFYTHTKAVLVELCREGLLPPADELFPVNPYPAVNRRFKGATPLSREECQRLLRALERDLSKIRAGELRVPDAQGLIIRLLLIAARTGLNTTPLLELGRDALRAHPIHPDRWLLITYKRRGSNTHIQSLQRPADARVVAAQTTIKNDVVTLYQEALALTAPLALLAPEPLRNRLWLQRPDRGTAVHQVTPLSGNTLLRGLQEIIARHDLRADDGQPLWVSISRLRKSFVNRIWELSGGDPLVMRRLAGHSLRVSDVHYLSVTPEMERNHKFVGEAWVAHLRSDFVPEGGTQSSRPRIIATAVAHCSDPIHGRYAPKDGSYCMDFLSCFRCPNQIVTGDDLYRLFSFYWLLVKERSGLGRNRWARVYGWVIREIDRAIAPRFPADRVTEARRRAREDPHPMWRDRAALGAAA